jgi:hypothetical protein
MELIDNEFTDDELYLIERTFDYMYSKLDLEMRRCAEQMMILNASGDINASDYLLSKKICSDLLNQCLRISESSHKHRMISEKCERIRHEKVRR